MDNFPISLAIVKQMPVATLVQLSPGSFTHQDQRSREAMNSRLSQMSKPQIETILHKQQESRNAVFADGSNIHMESGKYGTDDLRNACNQASQTCRHRQSKQAVITDISSMPATTQDVIRMAVGEEKRK